MTLHPGNPETQHTRQPAATRPGRMHGSLQVGGLLLALCFCLAARQTPTLAADLDVGSPFASLTLENVAPAAALQVLETYTAVIGLEGLPAYGLSTARFACRYDPDLIQLSPPQDAGLFGAGAVARLDGPSGGTFVYNLSGQSITNAGPALRLTFKALAAGTFSLECNISASTTGTEPIQLPFKAGAFTILQPVISTIVSGSIQSHQPVTLSLLMGNNLVSSSTLDANGDFQLNAPPGDYNLRASAAGCLNVEIPLRLGEVPTRLPALHMVAGDVNQDGSIDTTDANLIGLYYMASPLSSAFYLDINQDGNIDILDLEIIAQNFGLKAPISWK